MISALAILETPDPTNSQNGASSEDGQVEGPPAAQRDIITTPESENTWQFLWSLRQHFVQDLIRLLCGTFLGLAGCYFLSLAGIVDMTPDNILGFLPSFTIAVMGKMFAIPTSFNAITSQRSVARRHLHTEGGIKPVFIGLDIFIVYMLMTIVITALAKSVYKEETTFSVFILSRLVLGLTLTNLHTAWVHAVISKPTKKSLWERIPGWRKWLKILPVASLDIFLPICVHHLVKNLLIFFRGVLFAALGNQTGENHSALATWGKITFLAIPVVSEFLISLFTRVLYVKVAASMLPENEQSIVPFDRSFGGRANNETHCLSILDAFGTMKVQNCYRYLKIVWEVFMYGISWFCPFIIVILIELYYWAPDTVIDLIILFVPAEC